MAPVRPNSTFESSAHQVDVWETIQSGPKETVIGESVASECGLGSSLARCTSESESAAHAPMQRVEQTTRARGVGAARLIAAHKADRVGIAVDFPVRIPDRWAASWSAWPKTGIARPDMRTPRRRR